MATTAELLAQLERFLPPQFASYRPVLAGVAAAQAEAAGAADSMAVAGLYEGATGEWLDLHARSAGLRRATGESDANLRSRLRIFPSALTRPVLQDAVDALLAPYTATTARIIEWFQDGDTTDGSASGLGISEDSSRSAAWCGRSFCGTTRIVARVNSFLVVCPYLAPPSGYDLHPVFSVIINEVNRLRAAGTRWWLVLES